MKGHRRKQILAAVLPGMTTKLFFAKTSAESYGCQDSPGYQSANSIAGPKAVKATSFLRAPATTRTAGLR